MAQINPCTNPNLPPIRIELSDIRCAESLAQYADGVKVVKAYWRQAMNMTIEDQIEYKTLIEQQHFHKQGPALFFPGTHSVYKSCLTSPTWANQVQGIFKSLQIYDYEECYRAYNPKPASEKKRKATEQLQLSETQRSTSFSQPNAYPALGQASPVTKEDLEGLEARLKEYMDDHIKQVRENILEASAEHGEMIRTVIEQMYLVMDKMDGLEEDQTGHFDALEMKIDCMADTISQETYQAGDI